MNIGIQHIAHDNRTANTRKCLGIAAFGWRITDNNAFYLRKQLKNASKHFISLRWPTRERWKTVVFKRFLRIFCPRKWKETLCLRWKTSFKAIFRYRKTPVSNEYKPFSHLTPHSQHQENDSFRRANCQGKLSDNRTNTSIRRLENNGKIWILLSENVRKIHE